MSRLLFSLRTQIKHCNNTKTFFVPTVSQYRITYQPIRKMSILTGNKFDPNNDVPDLTGKTYLVTGGTAGIGFGIVAHLLQHNARVLLLSDKEKNADEAVEELKKWGDTSKAEWVKCNLASLKDTDEVAKNLAEKEGTINGVSLAIQATDREILTYCDSWC